MGKPKRFSFFKTETLNLNGVDVEIEGYRVVDNEYVLPLIEKRNEIYKLGLDYNQLYQNLLEKGPDGITEEDAGQVKELKDKVDKLLVELSELSYPLAQRGLKRALYKDEEEYVKAEQEDRLTEYIDSLPDVEIPPHLVNKVVNTMLKLSNPELVGELEEGESDGGESGKVGKKKRRKKSGSS